MDRLDGQRLVVFARHANGPAVRLQPDAVIVEEDPALIPAVVGGSAVGLDHAAVGDDVHEVGVALGHVGERRVGQTAEQVVVAAVDFLRIDFHRAAQRRQPVEHRLPTGRAGHLEIVRERRHGMHLAAEPAP